MFSLNSIDFEWHEKCIECNNKYGEKINKPCSRFHINGEFIKYCFIIKEIRCNEE